MTGLCFELAQLLVAGSLLQFTLRGKKAKEMRLWVVEKNMLNLETEKEALRVSMTVLHWREHKLWTRKLQELDQQYRLILKTKEEELDALEYSWHQIRQDVADNPRKRLHAVDLVAEQENIMATARQEAAQYRQAHQKINHTGNVLDGLENGLAARSVSGSPQLVSCKPSPTVHRWQEFHVGSCNVLTYSSNRWYTMQYNVK